MGLDIVIATPGRLIDHLHNSPNFSLADIEVLVLDEADRMLEEAFAEQMKELIRLCSKNRQTMLFSATMTDEIEDLARMSLNKPVRLFINDNTDTAMNLRQEFVRIRENKEEDREAVVAALVTRNFPDHAIVFVRTKRDCERLHVLLGLLGVKAAQLHGGLSQSQRVHALAAFKSQEIGVLCSTDLAARGLDIEGVMTVINLHMPMSMKHYVHRVGRTARAGKAGRSISLVGENDRTLLKSIVKMNKGHPLKQRVVAPEVISAYKEKIQVLNDSVKRIEEEEKTERAVRQAQVALEKTEEKLKSGAGAEERVWFQSSKEKKDEKKRIKAEFKKKQQEKEKIKKTPEEIQAERIAAFQAREAKRARRGKKIRTVVEDSEKRRSAAAAKTSRKRKKSSFTHELTSVGAKSVKKLRHGPEDMDFKNAKRAKMQKGAIRRPRK
ncbi:DEAD box protein box polypeptide 27 [Aphelenchoides avenae]|nr:DEAD box protein box polypeptide 27 [Aphelenchus avenae]